MSTTADLIDALKAELKAARIDGICRALRLDFAELARRARFRAAAPRGPEERGVHGVAPLIGRGVEVAMHSIRKRSNATGAKEVFDAELRSIRRFRADSASRLS